MYTLTLNSRERDLAQHASTFLELALSSVLPMLQRCPHDMVMVSGPVTTGGKGSKVENLKALKLAQNRLEAEGHVIFDQSIVEVDIERLTKLLSPNTYPTKLLQEFFLTIFKTGYIKKMYFLPDWESSQGATWERKRAISLGIEIIDIAY